MPGYIEATPAGVRRLLVETFEAMTGLEPGRIIVEGKSDRRPQQGLYCSLWFRSARPAAYIVADLVCASSTEFQWDATCWDAEEILMERPWNETFVQMQASFWGDGAHDAALEAVSALNLSERWNDLWRVIGFAGIDSVQDVPAPWRGQMQQRALFNMGFYVCYGRRYPAEWFDAAQTDVVWVSPGGGEIRYRASSDGTVTPME